MHMTHVHVHVHVYTCMHMCMHMCIYSPHTYHSTGALPRHCARRGFTGILSLPDVDERPSAGVRHSMRRLTEGSDKEARPFAGAQLFFDADRSCPASYCPNNEADWLARCAAQVPKGKRKPHFKNLAVPSRMHDLSVHWFVPKAGYGGLRLWRPCLLHESSAVF